MPKVEHEFLHLTNFFFQEKLFLIGSKFQYVNTYKVKNAILTIMF